MVTTPQEVALLDVRKAIGMFQRLNVPILGVVENMSYFVAPDTGKRYAIFFPHTLLPLHVFEARYRAMVMDSLARDRRLAVVKLKPGFEASYAGKPAVHAVAGAGEIVSWERLATGRYNILVKGEWRVQIESERPSDTPYRIVTARPPGDVAPTARPAARAPALPSPFR